MTTWQLLTLMISIVLTFSVGVYSFLHKGNRGAKTFVILSGLTLLWNVATLLEYSSEGFSSKLLWRNIQQIFGFLSPFFILYFALEYTKSPLLKPLRWVITLPITATLLVFTNPYHHLVRDGVRLISDNGGERLVVDVSPLGSVIVLTNISLAIVAVFFLVDYYRKTAGRVRRQILLISVALGLSVPLILMNLSVFPAMGLNFYTSTLLTPFLLAVFIGFFRYDFFSQSPLSKDTLLSSIQQMVIVTDNEGFIIEYNEAAERHFKAHHTTPIDLHITVDALFEMPLMVPLNKYTLAQEMTHLIDGVPRVFHIEFHPLIDDGGERGTMMIIDDITEKKAYEAMLKSRADHDQLTGLLNRSTFQQRFESLDGDTVIMILFDIDDFKQINDTYGHSVGDTVLRKISEILKHSTQTHCIVGRLGGEEFAAATVDMDQSTLKYKAEALRSAISDHFFETDAESISVTVSIGCAHASMPIDFETLRNQADKAMYDAKDSGKNTVRFYSEEK